MFFEGRRAEPPTSWEIIIICIFFGGEGEQTKFFAGIPSSQLPLGYGPDERLVLYLAFICTSICFLVEKTW